MNYKQKGVDHLKRKFWQFKAKKYIKDKDKTKHLVKRAFNKADKKQNIFTDIWENIQSLFGLVSDYSRGKYTEIPVKTIIMVIASVVYFVSPADAIPDLIPGVGFLDDVGVLTFVFESFKSDIEKYALWKQNSDDSDIIDVEEIK